MSEEQKEPKGTALVTGASAGLGKELASLFSKDGHDVVIVARSKSKLEALAADLEKTNGTKVHVVAADLGDAGAPKAIFEETKKRGLQIDYLVNNAGFGSNGAFLELDLDREVQMIDVNITALTRLTHLYGRPMKERGFGRILNIASTAGFQPGPFMATYYATKAYVVMFSEALAYELDGSGVTVTCHCPGATATEFATTAGNDKSKLFQRSGVAAAKEVALHAYKAMHKGEILAVHGFLNSFGVAALRITPRSVVRSIAAGMNKPA